MKPEFQKKEIIISEGKESIVLGGEEKEAVGTIVYIGKRVENYNVGDTVLYDKARVVQKIKYFGDTLLRIENEDYVTCKIVD